jgi:hypothetical protein
MGDFARRIPFLVENYKGLCFAAFADAATIATASRCTADEAAAIKGRALGDFAGLMLAVSRAKERVGPRGARA